MCSPGCDFVYDLTRNRFVERAWGLFSFLTIKPLIFELSPTSGLSPLTVPRHAEIQARVETYYCDKCQIRS
jgi:hypothetical protein